MHTSGLSGQKDKLSERNAVSDPDEKAKKKAAKAEAKAAKAEAKARAAQAEPGRMPGGGVSIAINKTDDGAALVVSGLRDDQLERILPQVNREVLITLAEEKNTLKAAMMRFVREGLFQTLIKVVAGLIVGYLLLQFGLK